jgi:hypothetical protein
VRTSLPIRAEHNKTNAKAANQVTTFPQAGVFSLSDLLIQQEGKRVSCEFSAVALGPGSSLGHAPRLRQIDKKTETQQTYTCIYRYIYILIHIRAHAHTGTKDAHAYKHTQLRTFAAGSLSGCHVLSLLRASSPAVFIAAGRGRTGGGGPRGEPAPPSEGEMLVAAAGPGALGWAELVAVLLDERLDDGTRPAGAAGFAAEPVD